MPGAHIHTSKYLDVTGSFFTWTKQFEIFFRPIRGFERYTSASYTHQQTVALSGKSVCKAFTTLVWKNTQDY